MVEAHWASRVLVGVARSASRALVVEAHWASRVLVGVARMASRVEVVVAHTASKAGLMVAWPWVCGLMLWLLKHKVEHTAAAAASQVVVVVFEAGHCVCGVGGGVGLASASARGGTSGLPLRLLGIS